MISFNILANKKLWESWTNLGRKVDSLKTIIQNDIKLSAKDVYDWVAEASALQTELEELRSETYSHILACKENGE